jgi:hypothetical protein
MDGWGKILVVASSTLRATGDIGKMKMKISRDTYGENERR